jgi:hypothetical protein
MPAAPCWHAERSRSAPGLGLQCVIKTDAALCESTGDLQQDPIPSPVVNLRCALSAMYMQSRQLHIGAVRAGHVVCATYALPLWAMTRYLKVILLCLLTKAVFSYSGVGNGPRRCHGVNLPEQTPTDGHL